MDFTAIEANGHVLCFVNVRNDRLVHLADEISLLPIDLYACKNTRNEVILMEVREDAYVSPYYQKGPHY